MKKAYGGRKRGGRFRKRGAVRKRGLRAKMAKGIKRAVKAVALSQSETKSTNLICPPTPESNLLPNGYQQLQHNSWCCIFPNLLLTAQGIGAPDLPLGNGYVIPRNRIGDSIIPRMIDIKMILEPADDFVPDHSYYVRWALVRRRTTAVVNIAGFGGAASSYTVDSQTPPTRGVTAQWTEQIITPFNGKDSPDRIVKSGVIRMGTDTKSVVKQINVKLPRRPIWYRTNAYSTGSASWESNDVIIPCNGTYQLWCCAYYDTQTTTITQIVRPKFVARMFFKDP